VKDFSSTISMTAMGALSPLRGPIFVMRVYPPGRLAMAGPISVNSVCRTLLSRTTLTTWRRFATVSVLAFVMSCSA
jgi:hypothetical protein